MNNHTNYGIISTEALKEKEAVMGVDLSTTPDVSSINGEVQEKKEDEEKDDEEQDQRGTPIAVLLKEANIRSTPSRENTKNILFSLPAGTEVVVMAQNEEWSNICLSSGIEAHILTNLLEFKLEEE